jgi:RNA polymerase sigma-70 factor, ECF subfamily
VQPTTTARPPARLGWHRKASHLARPSWRGGHPTRGIPSRQALRQLLVSREGMTAADPAEISRLVLACKSGDESALARLMPLVYDELHVLARKRLQGERTGHTLQTTALIHEAYLRLVGAEVSWEGRVHFFAIAAQTMRRILVDHARSRVRDKRGGGAAAVTLEDVAIVTPEPSDDLVALDEALERLAALDARKARVVELHYFGGLTYDETALAIGASAATVDRELRLAKAWLYRELRPERENP